MITMIAKIILDSSDPRPGSEMDSDAEASSRYAMYFGVRQMA